MGQVKQNAGFRFFAGATTMECTLILLSRSCNAINRVNCLVSHPHVGQTTAERGCLQTTWYRMWHVYYYIFCFAVLFCERLSLKL